MFKPNPKAQVENKYAELFGGDDAMEVRGGRLSPAQCRARGIPCGSRDGTYYVELYVGDRLRCAASHRDWRRAYKLLKIEVEKLYTESEFV